MWALHRGAVEQYLDTLDEAAFGAVTPVKSKLISYSDPASQCLSGHCYAMPCRQSTARRNGSAFFSCSENYLTDTDLGVIVPSRRFQSKRLPGVPVEC